MITFLTDLRNSIADERRPFCMDRWEHCICGHACQLLGVEPLGYENWVQRARIIAFVADAMGIEQARAERLFYAGYTLTRYPRASFPPDGGRADAVFAIEMIIQEQRMVQEIRQKAENAMADRIALELTNV